MGLGLYYVKLGGLSGAERMTKYNRLISIEEELAQQGILGRFYILLPFLFFSRTRKRRPNKARERERGSNAWTGEHISPYLFLFWMQKESVCEQSYKCVFVCVNGRIKALPLDLLIGCLITHRDKYFPIHHSKIADRDTRGLMSDED